MQKKHLLKNVTKKVVKGLQIGALTALMAGATTGCGVEMTSERHVFTKPGGQHTYDHAFEKRPYIFSQTDFTPEQAGFYFDGVLQENMRARTRQVQKYALDKLTDWQDDLATFKPNNRETALRTRLDELYQTLMLDLTNLTSFDAALPDIQTAVAGYLAQLVHEIPAPEDQKIFRLCYARLAAREYCATYSTDTAPAKPASYREIDEVLDPELRAHGIDDLTQVEDYLYDTLDTIGTHNAIAITVLRESVDVALMTEGMYGLANQAKAKRLYACTTEHTRGIRYLKDRTSRMMADKLDAALHALDPDHPRYPEDELYRR